MEAIMNKFMGIAIEFVGIYWSYLNVDMTDRISIQISLARIIRYLISFMGCYITPTHYLNRFRTFAFANGPLTDRIAIWMKT